MSGRSLVSYLILPRPQELVAKASFFLAVPLVVALAAGPSRTPRIGDALAFVFALEVLVYQARYQWNDIRGFAEDQRHPAAAERGRLPGPRTCAREQIALSAGVIALRLVLAAVIGLLLGQGLGGALLVASVSVWGVAFVYEALRHSISERVSGSPLRPTAAKRLLYVVVGLGYATRAVSGLWVGSAGTLPAAGVVAAAVTMSAIGSMFVTMSWLLEATSLVGRDADGKLVRSRVLAGKGHLAALLTSVGIDRDLPEGTVLESMSGRALTKPGGTPRSPWSLALIAAATAGSYGSLSLARHMGIPTAHEALLGCSVGLLAALVAASTPWWTAVLIGPALAGFLWVVAASRTPSRPWMAVVIPALLFVLYAVFRRTSYDAINAGGRAVARPAARAPERGEQVAARTAPHSVRLTSTGARLIQALVPSGASRRVVWRAVTLLAGADTTAVLRNH